MPLVKFLVVRFSSIGDIVLTTPVIRCLKKQVGGAEVHYLTKKQYSLILENNPYIDKLWILDNDLKNLINKLKNEEFDYIIDLHHNLRTLRLKNSLRTLSFSFNKLNFRKWLIVNFKINRLPDIHIVDRYLETVRLFDVKNDNEGLDYFLPDDESILPEEIKSNPDEKYIVLSIGAQHHTKKLPSPQLAEICSGLNHKVVILGGPSDTGAASEITRLSTNRNILDLTGKINLNKSAAVIQHSTLVITHDTGLMHIAAAFRKKVISIWGNTVPGFGMYPYMAAEGSRVFEIKGLNCRPCSKIGYRECPRGHFKCMLDHNTMEIARFANYCAINL